VNIRSIVLLCLFLLFPLASHALEITGLRIESKEQGEHVSLRLTSKVNYKIFKVDNPPPRIVVDVPLAHWKGTPALPKDYRGRLIKKMRFGFHDTKTNRLVFELYADAKLDNIRLIGSSGAGAYWLEFDLMTHSSAHSRSLSSESTLTKAPEKPMIVIDAGHGGQDPGTSGYNGSMEKQLTLRYARNLQDALLKTGRYRVTLTRSDDRYLLLRERVKRARQAKGELFISLHADSAPTRTARGLSVYTISAKASDKEAEALAAKENKADVIGGMDLSDASKDVANILIDLAERETRAKSTQFADLAVKNLGREVKLLSNTHRFAGFAVLKAPDIPSVLIEVGFLTSPREEHLLQSQTYQGKVVRGIVKAIDSYFGKHKK